MSNVPPKRLRTKTLPTWEQRLCDAGEPPELLPEDASARKTVYLVTIAHPTSSHSSSGVALVAPDNVSRAKLRDAILDACNNPVFNDMGNAAKAHSVKLVYLVVFRERHTSEDGSGHAHAHYHIALKSDKQFKFLGVKRALLQRHGLASHWSCSHDGYWSAVRYCFMPSAKKTLAMLDQQYLTWASKGDHMPLLEACQEPTTAAALRKKREAVQPMKSTMRNSSFIASRARACAITM